ncbi:peptide deformylase [Sphingomonas yunnanensis]|uniref:peptide deformylase n=1 Tax=Sphingomonas yunnanensis TaxID=310400 RepID=UPI001CA6AF76|nr:peptide deformylase [Sphingomonas yunnanensis]MBY9061983.1 peptide deformylase [Sphingomonas yunnanensis]
MAILPIVEVPDARLRETCVPVAEVNDEVRGIVADMFDTMYDARGIGLAAIQVGILQRIVVIDLQERELEEGEPPEAARAPQAFINPEISWISEEQSSYNEGCLSIPEQYAEVTRPERCRVTWRDTAGERHEAEFEGLMSTCMQHEIDHLNGVLFIDHISRLKRGMLLKKLDKLRRGG